MKYKVDLHTHSILSHDGGITELQYQKILNENLVNYIAVTDHNSIELAMKLNGQFGERIIVGEEIMTTAGEIIGLYLTETIPPGLSPEQTIQKIRQQNGIVYIPHPFETIRKGLHPQVMEEIVNEIDIVEVCSGRAFAQNKSEQTVVWAKLNKKPGAASSDAHGLHGVGRAYTLVNERPTRNNLIELVSNSIPNAERPRIRALLYPKYNKMKKKVSKNV